MADPSPTTTLPETPTPTCEIAVYTPAQSMETAYGASYNHYSNRIISHTNADPALIAHEAKHQQNADLHNLPMNLTQHYKLHMHDEVSAYLTELVHLRQQYCEARTEEERQQIINSPAAQTFEWYWQAVKEGKTPDGTVINPLSTNPQDNQAEFAWMAQQTQKQTLTILGTRQDYRHTISEETKYNFNTSNLEDLAANDANYRQALNQMYTIGGHNFAHELGLPQNDIQDYTVPSSIRQADADIASGKSREEAEQTLEINLSEENKKLYEKIREGKIDLSSKKNQEFFAKQILGNNYKNPTATIQIFDLSTRFLEEQYLQNQIRHANESFNAEIAARIQHDQQQWETQMQQNLDARMQQITTDLSQRATDFNTQVDNRQNQQQEQAVTEINNDLTTLMIHQRMSRS